MRHAGVIVLGVLLVLLAGVSPGQEPAEKSDEQILKEARLPTEPVGLVKFLRGLSPTVEQQKLAAGLVAKLGANAFAERETASEELAKLLPAAVVVLRGALLSEDAEIVDRARELMQQVEKDGTFLRYRAAVRVVLKKPPAGSHEALLALLPVCNDELAEEVLDGLVRLGVKGDPLPAVVTAALEESEPTRRAAAALLLGRAGTAEQRRKVHGLLNDASLEVRLRAALGLLAARDRAGLPVLVQAVREGTALQAKVANDLLIALAGVTGVGSFDCATLSQRQALARAWDGWLQNHGRTLDLTRADVEYGSLNRTLTALQLARQFMALAGIGDPMRLKPLIGLPYSHLDAVMATTPQELEGVFQNHGWPAVNRGELPPTTRVMPLDSLPRTLANTVRNVTQRHPREDVVAIETLYRQSPGFAPAATRTVVFLRVSKTGPARVVGYSYVNLDRSSF